jgi:hypothetical protein
MTCKICFWRYRTHSSVNIWDWNHHKSKLSICSVVFRNKTFIFTDGWTADWNETDQQDNKLFMVWISLQIKIKLIERLKKWQAHTCNQTYNPCDISMKYFQRCYGLVYMTPFLGKERQGKHPRFQLEGSQ